MKSFNMKNEIVVDLYKDNEMKIYINFTKNYDFEKDYDFKNYIKKYIKTYSESEMRFKELSYVVMMKIIDRFSKSAEFNNFDVVVSEKLKDYIKSKNIEIEKRKELGASIKKRKNFVYEEYLRFSELVNKEMYRELRESQMWDAFFIKQMVKSANYSVPGAGKTSIVYGAFSYLNSPEINKVKKIIMIGPKPSFKSWRDEFHKCFASKKKLRVLNVHDEIYKNTSDRIHALRFDSANSNLILINYEMLPSVEDVLLELINDEVMLVFDEVHKVKAREGVFAESALKIAREAMYKVILTGTPIPNTYLDLFNQLKILFPDEYNVFFGFSPQYLRRADEFEAEVINEKIYPFFCRTTKKDLSVPEANPDIKIICDMNYKEKKLFKLLRTEFDGGALELFIRLLQAATNPKLLLSTIEKKSVPFLFLGEDEDDNYDLEDKEFPSSEFFEREDVLELINSIDMSTKYWKCVETVEKLTSEGKQLIIWSVFVDTIKRLEKNLSEKGIKVKVIHGDVPLEEREKLIDDFKDKEFQVLVTNPHTMGESVSLHDTCHDAIYLEYTFNLTHMLQSRDRINRLGLKPDQYTQYYYLFLRNDNLFEDSIDMRTYERLEEKTEVMLNAIERDSLTKINFDIIDDLKRILRED